MACTSAAYGGHLHVLQWLREYGCDWDYTTCLLAAKSGHVELLRWARENGCEWDAITKFVAAQDLGYTDDLGNLVEGGVGYDLLALLYPDDE